MPVYVLDASLQLVPVDVPGEFYIGGLQVARGYLHHPELDAERFIPDAFSGLPGARLYRTGDQVRWKATGQLEYLQRAEAQVKVRGFHIEPGEVEAVLLQQPAVKQAVVAARGEGTAEWRVAYLVPRAGFALETAALKAELGRRLPEYMVPSSFMRMEALPLTIKGKVTHKALPEPDVQAASQYVPPHQDMEAWLAALLAEVLRVPRVGVTDDFFALGGHSLLTTQALSPIRSTFQVELPLRGFFEAPTLEGLAKRRRSSEPTYESCPRGSRRSQKSGSPPEKVRVDRRAGLAAKMRARPAPVQVPQALRSRTRGTWRDPVKNPQGA
ncbi:phosphopantetheine-binding protein [Corallococcus llansteffanensis]|uniref:phosphopantetheine-binding protein n=1 Tax=Corallococcus llansteffanensis TaxID=2316731 RepID=UPI0011C4900E